MSLSKFSLLGLSALFASQALAMDDSGYDAEHGDDFSVCDMDMTSNARNFPVTLVTKDNVELKTSYSLSYKLENADNLQRSASCTQIHEGLPIIFRHFLKDQVATSSYYEFAQKAPKLVNEASEQAKQFQEGAIQQYNPDFRIDGFNVQITSLDAPGVSLSDIDKLLEEGLYYPMQRQDIYGMPDYIHEFILKTGQLTHLALSIQFTPTKETYEQFGPDEYSITRLATDIVVNDVQQTLLNMHYDSSSDVYSERDMIIGQAGSGAKFKLKQCMGVELDYLDLIPAINLHPQHFKPSAKTNMRPAPLKCQTP